MKGPEMAYILTGFTQEIDVRVFSFECVGGDRARTKYAVKADLTLIRKYGIRPQELPLLCRAVLERRNELDDQRTFIYTEADMCLHAHLCTSRDEAAQNKKAHRRPPKPAVENAGASWRGPKL